MAEQKLRRIIECKIHRIRLWVIEIAHQIQVIRPVDRHSYTRYKVACVEDRSLISTGYRTVILYKADDKTSIYCTVRIVRTSCTMQPLCECKRDIA